jgi:hypothetical protein
MHAIFRGANRTGEKNHPAGPSCREDMMAVGGGRAIDRELDRIKPLLEQGGYVPHLDHLVPPDIPYRNYCEYLEK